MRGEGESEMRGAGLINIQFSIKRVCSTVQSDGYLETAREGVFWIN